MQWKSENMEKKARDFTFGSFSKNYRKSHRFCFISPEIVSPGFTGDDSGNRIPQPATRSHGSRLISPGLKPLQVSGFQLSLSNSGLSLHVYLTHHQRVCEEKRKREMGRGCCMMEEGRRNEEEKGRVAVRGEKRRRRGEREGFG